MPPYHTPVFVLTNHARDSCTMDGGTTFHFVTDGIHQALQRAREAANGQDVRLGGIRKRLTAITVLIMVPNFVASIYGMNSANMLPPSESAYAFPPIVASSW